MTEAELLQKLKTALVDCAGWAGDEVVKDRERAINNYHMRLRGDEVAGRATVVSGDVSAMVEANLSMMLDAYTSENIAEFVPLDGPDEDQAQLESDVVTYFVMSKQNGYLHLAAAIKDALLVRNGVVKVWVETREIPKTEQYTGVTDEAFAELTNRPGIECTVVKYDAGAGELTLRCKHTVRRFRAEAVPLENFLYLKNWPSLEIQDIPICAERHVDTRSDLLELFPKAKSKIERLSRWSPGANTTADTRNPWLTQLSHHAPVDASQELIEWFEVYVLVDKDGDGISERRKVALHESEILDDVPVNLVPYGVGTAILNPHRLQGISIDDKVSQIQDKNTALERALLDNVNTVTKQRLAYLDGKVNVDDVSDGRPNGAIRVKANVADIRTALMPFEVPDQSSGILQNIEYQKRVRTELGGAALDMASGNLQLNDRLGSQGVDRVYSVQEQLAAMMTRFIGATLIRSVWLLAHATLRENFTEPVPVKRNGKWITAVPSKWPERECVHVKPGMSPGERTRRANALMQILNSQVQLAGLGMDEVLVNLDGFYRTLMDWARVSDIQNPEQYFRDPQSPEAVQAIQSKQKAAAAAQQQQKALMQQAIELERIGRFLEKYTHDSELQFKYWEKTQDVEVEEAKLVGAAAIELVKAKTAPKPDAPDNPKASSGSAPSEPAAA